MPFGLKNAAQSFQLFINQVLMGLDFTFAYIDDILIASSSAQEHEQHIKAVFNRLREHGLYNSADKCAFRKESVEFLGYQERISTTI